MHSLLDNDKVTHLSLANNPKLTTIGFKYVAVYIKGVSIYAQVFLFSLFTLLYSLVN